MIQRAFCLPRLSYPVFWPTDAVASHYNLNPPLSSFIVVKCSSRCIIVGLFLFAKPFRRTLPLEL
jgi:hypothetical protein